ncbi:hypothetical protein ACTWQO_17285, partial [Streptomyces sp. 4N124]
MPDQSYTGPPGSPGEQGLDVPDGGGGAGPVPDVPHIGLGHPRGPAFLPGRPPAPIDPYAHTIPVTPTPYTTPRSTPSLPFSPRTPT